jgi:hypothetical protein
MSQTSSVRKKRNFNSNSAVATVRKDWRTLSSDIVKCFHDELKISKKVIYTVFISDQQIL